MAASRSDRHTVTGPWARAAAGASLAGVVALGVAGCSADTEDPPPRAAINLGVPAANGPADPQSSASAPGERPGADAGSGDPAGGVADLDDLDDSPIVAGLVEVDELADLDVDDQVGDGRTVRVQQVRLSQGTGFVAIYDASLTVLGVARVGAGAQPVTVRFDDRAVQGGELLAILHRDDGDGGFDPGADPTVMADGEAVGEDFNYVIRAGQD